jgi:hypothetical protein
LIEFGKFKGSFLSQIPENELVDYAQYLETASLAAKKPLNDKAQLLVEKIKEISELPFYSNQNEK